MARFRRRSRGKAKEELELLRKQANEIDGIESPYKVNCLRDDAERGLGRAQP